MFALHGFTDDVQRKVAHIEQREKLGLAPVPKPRSKAQTLHPEPTDAYQKVEVRKSDPLFDELNLFICYNM